MERRDDPPPPYFGSYPDGPYWSAVPPGAESDVEEEDDAVHGGHLEIMWDEGAGPLWGVEGLLPDEPAWLRRALGLSEVLIADLLSWRDDMSAFNDGPHEDWLADHEKLDVRASELAERLQEEVGARYVVRHRA